MVISKVYIHWPSAGSHTSASSAPPSSLSSPSLFSVSRVSVFVGVFLQHPALVYLSSWCATSLACIVFSDHIFWNACALSSYALASSCLLAILLWLASVCVCEEWRCPFSRYYRHSTNQLLTGIHQTLKVHYRGLSHSLTHNTPNCMAKHTEIYEWMENNRKIEKCCKTLNIAVGMRFNKTFK